MVKRTWAETLGEKRKEKERGNEKKAENENTHTSRKKKAVTSGTNFLPGGNAPFVIGWVP